MSWLSDVIFEVVLQVTGEAIHKRFGSGGCLSVVLVAAVAAALVAWWAGVFA